MAAILKTFADLNFYTRTCFIDYYHISFKKSHQTLRPRSCRVNQKFGPWISDYKGEKSVEPRRQYIKKIDKDFNVCDFTIPHLYPGNDNDNERT